MCYVSTAEMVEDEGQAKRPNMADGATVRRANKADAGDVAILINVATHGLMADIWGRESGADGTYSPIEVG